MTEKSSSVRTSVKENRQRSAKKRSDLGGSHLIEHIRQLAWTGQHAAAIDAVNEELRRGGCLCTLELFAQ